MSNPKLSIALCTCNGEKYIEQQLLSILNQSLPIDEIVISDDISEDATIEKIEELLRHSVCKVKILRNPTKKRYGVCANFEKAISHCTGDIIFFSDQDDIWLPDKTLKIVNYFACNPDKKMVFSDAYLIDNNDNIITDREGSTATLMKNNGYKYIINDLLTQDYALEWFLTGNICTGATIACDANWIKSIPLFQYGEGILHHDAVCSFVAIANNVIGFLNDMTIKYRIHSEQVCGVTLFASHIHTHTTRQYFYPIDNYFSNITFDRWLLHECIIKRIHLYNYRSKILLEKKALLLILLNVRKYLKVYGNLHIWYMDVINYMERILLRMNRRIMKLVFKNIK